MPRSAFAWEWLRRSSRYRDAWVRRGGQTGSDASCPPESFGLVDYENPAFSAAVARPLWTRSIDPTVLVADVLDRDPEPGDAFNLLNLASLAKLHVGVSRWEHLLLSDGIHGIRLDIATGSVVGSPTLLAYRIQGQASAKGPAETLRQLTALVQRMAFSANLFPQERRTARWILELRTADAIASGASAHEIAAHFYPALTAERRWRVESYAARRRVQRLVARARNQHVDADVRKWFVQDSIVHP
ncbi:DNA -binding domain-containing protein [Sphingomonas paeninsulae]